MFGIPQSFGTYSPVRYGTSYATPGAFALDAADGVLDGKYFGHKINSAYPITTLPSAIPTTTLSNPCSACAVVTPACTQAVMPSVVTSSYTPSYSSYSSPFTIPVTAPVSSSLVLPPTDLSVITNVPPLGTTSVSVVDCGYVAPSVVPQQLLLPPTFSTYSSVPLETQTTLTKRELPGAALFAAEFHDLRAMLDKDRDAFEHQRQQFEKSIAEREVNLKVGQEKLIAAEAAFEAKVKAESTITVKSLQEGQQLDIKDGIIDGKFNGKQIIVEGSGPLIPPPHLMGKPVPPPGMGKGKGGPPPPPGKGGKGMPPPPGKGGKGVPPPGPPGSPPRFIVGQPPQLGSPPPAGKGAPPPPGKGAPPPPGKGAPPAGKGVPPPGKGGKGGPIAGRGPPPPH
eukprot:GGOE01004328.1.p1 GENE.GGOE01004328.1~~GGOE01004328.1.p1  ORF type:complete len:396 (-),score=15.04 GGOE01004328.1:290-1477(-)